LYLAHQLLIFKTRNNARLDKINPIYYRQMRFKVVLNDEMRLLSRKYTSKYQSFFKDNL